jgi:indolepyruvate ferredoxin oxidoreductase beta subunit
VKFDLFLTGVGGEGVLTTGVIIARAAALEGFEVRGIQLHGLAQRGGTIPTIVRFAKGEPISSPAIMQGHADLVLAFEPMEAARGVYYASKKKTGFVVNDAPYMPVYANLLNLPYPTMKTVIGKVKPFAKKVFVFNTHELAVKEFGDAIFGNIMLVGAAVGKGLLPLKKKSLEKAIRHSVPRHAEKNLKAFERGVELGKKK